MNNTMTGITAIAPPAAIPVQSTVFSPLNAYSLVNLYDNKFSRLAGSGYSGRLYVHEIDLVRQTFCLNDLVHDFPPLFHSYPKTADALLMACVFIRLSSSVLFDPDAVALLPGSPGFQLLDARPVF